MQTTPHAFATRAIHEGYDPLSEHGALVPPLHLSSTFASPTAEDMGARFAGEAPGFFYSRIANPTVDLLERRIASLEGAEASLGTASGMGAITATLWSLLQQGDEIITDHTVYGCTFAFMRDGLSRYGVNVRHVDLTQPEALRAAITPKTRAIFFETPDNPNMRLVDIAAVSQIAHAAGALVIVDNTYSTPYLCRPIALGADLVIHSATKYLGGHGDLVAGVVSGSAALIQQIRLVGVKDMTGAVMSPFTAMLIMRGLKTLPLRLDRHCASAAVIAPRLQAHPAVARVRYPGLPSHPQHALALRQMDLPGGMIAFEMKGGKAAGIALINRLNLITCAVSLGDAESLMQHPASMTHSTYSPQERAAYGISDGLIRLSVGLEDVNDILCDLLGALDAIHRAA